MLKSKFKFLKKINKIEGVFVHFFALTWGRKVKMRESETYFAKNL